VQPWGPDPPPAPGGTRRAARRALHSTLARWSRAGFTPIYWREGEVVRAEIDLKGNCWSGSGRGATEEAAAWNALQDCIANWEADIARHSLRGRVRAWIGRRR
jgi:hypothetical protein